MTVTGPSGAQYRLDPSLLSDGGEGKIYRVLGGPDKKVAKLYKPGVISRELVDKLVLMLKNPPAASVLSQVAWPLDLVFDDGMQPCGFIMPELSINTELGDIYRYNPGDPKRTLPISTEQKTVIAMNICAVISAVHDAGYVFGDFNPRNIGVDKNSGRVAFLDTDSYHVTDIAKNAVYRCTVCAPGYAAPELITRCASHVASNPRDSSSAYAKAPLPTFTKDTDNFALAIHVFKLLMNGFNPFGGIIDTVSASQGSPGVGDAAVRRDSYCFKPGYKHQSAAILPLGAFPREIGDLFTRAFISGRSDPAQRPSARDWYGALDFYQQTLVDCPRNPLHQYFRDNKSCPYCEADDRYLGRKKDSAAKALPPLAQKTYTPIKLPTRTSTWTPLQAPPPGPTPQQSRPAAQPSKRGQSASIPPQQSQTAQATAQSATAQPSQPQTGLVVQTQTISQTGGGRKANKKARKVFVPVILICVALLITAFVFRERLFPRAEPELHQAETERQRTDQRLQESYLLAVNSADALRSGDKYGAIDLALSALMIDQDAGFPYSAEATKALADALGVYDLSDGFKPHRLVTLPSGIIDLAIAPDGTSFAAMSLGKMYVFAPESGELLADLPVVDSGLASVSYVDGSHLVYAAPDGLTLYDLQAMTTIWTGEIATTIAVSGDGKKIAAVNRDDSSAAVYDTDTGSSVEIAFGSRNLWTAVNERFGDQIGSLLELNYDGTMLAAGFSNGGLEIFDLADSRNNIELFDDSEYTYFEGGFFGRYFAFSASTAEESLFEVIDTQSGVTTISTILPGRVDVSADENGVYMSYDGRHVAVDPVTAEQTPLGYNPHEKAAGGYRVDGSPNSPFVRVSRYESHLGKVILAYIPSYSHTDARMNLEGNRFILYSHFYSSIYGIDGSLLAETEIPNAQQVYDVQYVRQKDESHLEVFYDGGSVNCYSDSNGELVSTYSKEKPDTSLGEEFLTENLRIESPLDGAAIVYNIRTGDLVRELEKDAYLISVTQDGEHVVALYITASGDRFGLIHDGENCETLAYVPNLCDVIGARLIIDDRTTGTLRETRLYSVEELIEMAMQMK